MSNYWLNIYKPRGISSAKLVSIVKKIYSCEMKSSDTKFNLEKSKESVSRGAERILIREHLRTYKDDVANFSSLASILGKVKIGHAGTLDVEAEGVLPLAVGEATKLIQLLIDAKKAYVFTVKFGTQTDSGDYAGKVIATKDYIPSKEEAYVVCSKFIGSIKQTPPAFSALKVNGVRAYKLARVGKEVELKPRNITIYDLKCLNYDEKNATATYYTECSKGTYIRTLAEDLALSLQSLGFVIELRRTQVGIFKEETAIHIISPEEITKEFLETKSIKIEAILDDILVLDATDSQAQQIKYGQKCLFDYEKDVNLLWVRYKGVLLAIGSLNESCFNSLRVFNL